MCTRMQTASLQALLSQPPSGGALQEPWRHEHLMNTGRFEYPPVAVHRITVGWEKEFVFGVTEEASTLVLGLHEPACPRLPGGSPEKPAPGVHPPPQPPGPGRCPHLVRPPGRASETQWFSSGRGPGLFITKPLSPSVTLGHLRWPPGAQPCDGHRERHRTVSSVLVGEEAACEQVRGPRGRGEQAGWPRAGQEGGRECAESGRASLSPPEGRGLRQVH